MAITDLGVTHLPVIFGDAEPLGEHLNRLLSGGSAWREDAVALEEVLVKKPIAEALLSNANGLHHALKERRESCEGIH